MLISKCIKRIISHHLVWFICVILMGISTTLWGEWQFSTIDSIGLVGGYANLVFDTSWNEHVAYSDYGNGWIKYAYWDGNNWQVEVVDTGNVQYFISLVLDDYNHPHIAYYEDLGTYAGHLKYAHWNGSSWQIETVDNSVDCGQDNAIDIDSNGYPHISYADNANVDLRYAFWDGASWHLETIDSIGYVGLYGDMVLDENDHAHICYRNNSTGDLKYAEWDGSNWQVETIESEGSVGAFTSIALDSMGYEHISYYDWPDSLKYAYWDGSIWHTEFVDDGGRYTSLALDSNDYPHISHHDLLNTSLKYAKWNGSSWDLETVENSGQVGVSTAIALDETDLPHIAYRDLDSGDLDYTWFEPTVGIEQEQVLNEIPSLFNVSYTYLSPHEIIFNLEIPQNSNISLKIFDISGREVSNLISCQLSPAFYKVNYKPQSKGTYFFRLESSYQIESGKFIIVE